MIESEVLAIFYNSAEGIAKYFTGRLQLPWPSYDGRPVMVVGSRLRNCLIHKSNTGSGDPSKVADGEVKAHLGDPGLRVRRSAPTEGSQ